MLLRLLGFPFLFSLQDLLQRGSLSLKSLTFRVLDEADEMLNMGFVDDVEAILGEPPAVSCLEPTQTLTCNPKVKP